jgi:transcriptional regulator with XRE-family HTH domain
VLRLQFERNNRHISQAALGRATRIAQPHISLIEQGRLIPTNAQLARLGAFFGLPPHQLMKDVCVLTPTPVAPVVRETYVVPGVTS